MLYAGGLPGPQLTRLGITVSRRVGTAVVRNRIKRRVREAFRLRLRAMLPSGTAMVIIARPGAGTLGIDSLNHEIAAGVEQVARRLAAKDNS